MFNSVSSLPFKNTYISEQFSTRLYIILGWVDDTTGNVSLSDYTGVGDVSPELDTDLGGQDNILAFNGIQRGGQTTLKWKRFFNTGDSKDAVVSAGVTNVIYAYNRNTDGESGHLTTDRASNNVTFLPSRTL